MRHRLIPAALGCLLLACAACGDDDSGDVGTPAPAATDAPSANDAPTTAPAPSAPATDDTEPEGGDAAGVDPADAEYCAAVEAINSTDAMPTVDDVRAYLEVAPEEVHPPVELVIAKLEEAGGDFMAVFADEAAGAALEEITAFEEARCGTGDDGPPQDPMVTVVDETATRVDLVATEYAYEGDLPTSEGRYSFVMSNEGAEPHIMILLRLEDGASLDEVLAAEGDEGVAETYESSPAMPGGEGVLTTDLVAGTWVLLCPIPGPEGHPHFVDGMIREFTIG